MAANSPREALLAAIVAKLAASAAVVAIVGRDRAGNARVYDEVPPGEDKGGETGDITYVYVGPINFGPNLVSCGQARLARVRVFAMSEHFGRVKVAELGHAVFTALDDAALTLDAPYRATEPLQVTADGDVIEPDDPKSVFVDATTVLAWA